MVRQAGHADHGHIGARCSNEEGEPLPGFRGNGVPEEHEIEIASFEVTDCLFDGVRRDEEVTCGSPG